VLYGIDISKWQEQTPSLAGKSFVFIRASIGIMTDERYSQHYQNVREAGLVVGAYHFNATELSVKEQVETFLAKAKDADILALDVEGPEMQFTDAQARSFIYQVHQAGRKIGLYHSLSGYPRDLGQDFRWVAAWRVIPPDINWDFWQYRGSPLDLDKFDGTLEQLTALGDGMAKAVNGTTRVLASNYYRTIVAGTPIYADTAGTRMTKQGSTANCDDVGVPYGGPAGWAYIHTGSIHFDSDPEMERGFGLVKTNDPGVGKLTLKNAEQLKATASRYSACVDLNGSYNDGLAAAKAAVNAVPPKV